jgi:hypothetical protein
MLMTLTRRAKDDNCEQPDTRDTPTAAHGKNTAGNPTHAETERLGMKTMKKLLFALLPVIVSRVLRARRAKQHRPGPPNGPGRF